MDIEYQTIPYRLNARFSKQVSFLCISLQVLNKEADVKTELKYVYDAITLTRKTIDGKVPLIGFAGAPVSFQLFQKRVHTTTEKGELPLENH